MPAEDYQTLNNLLPENDIEEWENNRYRMAGALKLSKLYNMDFAGTYSNFDSIAEALYGERISKTPKTLWKAVSDSFTLGTNQRRLSDIGKKLLVTEAGEGVDKETARRFAAVSGAIQGMLE